jgi:hypothetical protein
MNVLVVGDHGGPRTSRKQSTPAFCRAVQRRRAKLAPRAEEGRAIQLFSVHGRSPPAARLSA